MPTGGGEETRVIEPTSCIGPFALWERGIYFLTPSEKKGDQDINAYDLSTGETRKLLTIKAPWGWITTSPDGQTLLYVAYDNPGMDLMLVENFR